MLTSQATRPGQPLPLPRVRMITPEEYCKLMQCRMSGYGRSYNLIDACAMLAPGHVKCKTLANAWL